MVLSIALVVLGAGLAAAGILGCVLPVLPGPPLNWLALLCVHFAFEPRPFGGAFLLGTAAAAVVVTILDNVVPVAGAKAAGATRAGVWGSVIGMIVGTFAFPPFGIFIGAFAGAFLGEVLAGQRAGRSLKAAGGVFAGFVLGTLMKLAVSGVLTWYFVLAAWRGFAG